MTVRLTPRARPERTLVLGGVVRIYSDGGMWQLHRVDHVVLYAVRDIAAIELDDAPGDWW